MAMTYVIGFNESQPEDEQWAEFRCNSTTDIHLRNFIDAAIEDRYPELYEKMADQVFFEEFKFDELSQIDFMKVIMAIREYAQKGEFIPSGEMGAELWNDFIEPLVVIDERYDPNFQIEE